MKIGILDIGTDKISCFIVNVVKDKEPIILGIGQHQSNLSLIAQLETKKMKIISINIPFFFKFSKNIFVIIY